MAGALPGATALVRPRLAWRSARMRCFWAAARKFHGDAAGTRELIDVLLLHRHMPAGRRRRRVARPLSVGASLADVVGRGGPEHQARHGVTEPSSFVTADGQQSGRVVGLDQVQHQGCGHELRTVGAVFLHQSFDCLVLSIRDANRGLHCWLGVLLALGNIEQVIDLSPG